MNKDRKWWKTVLKVILWFIGIWAALLVILQLTLTEKTLEKLVDRYAAEYIDGDISFGKASVSMFKRFPRIFLSLDDFAVTYPADRFDAQEKMGVQGHLMHHGCGETADTLASFDRFSASINVVSLIGGTIRIPHLRLVQPRIFAHSYADGKANWNMFHFESGEEEADSTSTGLPDISLGRISFSRHPHIVYTDSRDTVFAMIDIARISFNGQIRTKSPNDARNKIGLTVDSMFVAGRLKRDTLALAVDHFNIHEHEGHMDIDARAKALLATGSFGRIHLPIGMSGRLDFPKDTVPAVTLDGFKANIGDFPLVADADLRFKEGKTGIKAKVGLKDCKLNDVFHGFAKDIIPELANIQTDAALTMLAECDGDYINATGKLPAMKAAISLPEASLSYSGLDSLKLTVSIAANGRMDRNGRIYAGLDSLRVDTRGLYVNLSGAAEDLTGADPLLKITGRLDASLDTLTAFLPDTLGLTAFGTVTADLLGSALMSQLNMYNFSRADINGKVISDEVMIRMPDDSLDVNIKGLDITLAPEERTSRRDSTRKFRLIGITAAVANADIAYGNAFSVKAQDLSVSAKNSISQGKEADTTARINPLSGRLIAKRLIVKDAASTSLNLRNTNNGFMLMPKKGQPQVPVMRLTSKSDKITLSSGKNRAILTDADIRARAAMNTVERRQKAKAFMDSLARVYPDIPRDSLFAHMRAQRGSRPVPEWMKEEDFRKQDIDIRLDETMARYFRNWDLDGSIGVRTGIVMTPHFPLRNILRGFDLSFTNNEVKIDSFKVVAGKSEIEARGSLTGLKNALLGRGRRAMKFNLDVSSDGMDANELLSAYQKGSQYVPDEISSEEVSDADLLKMVTSSDSTAVADSIMPSLIVVPANLNADIRVNAANVKYTDLLAESITAKLVMKERCVQITDTKAKTNMGDISFDAFYSTRSKKDIKAGFDLNFKDITADKVISLMPAIDTIMPLLKSFSGLLNCEVAATTSLDTNMNLVMPSINGVIRIGGEDLSIKGSEMYRSLARKLLFKNKKEGHIEKMTVEGMIKDNTLEVFPFVIKMDRYMLALSGIQNMDMSYRYHASLIKSPFLIRLGVDIYGPDFDNMKFKIGKAKYKNGNVPVFTAVVDQTKINLAESIRNIFDKGVDAAVRENIRQAAILDHKQKIGYVNAVDMKLEELSASEQKQMEAEQAADQAAEAAESGETAPATDTDAQEETTTETADQQ